MGKVKTIQAEQNLVMLQMFLWIETNYLPLEETFERLVSKQESGTMMRLSFKECGLRKRMVKNMFLE